LVVILCLRQQKRFSGQLFHLYLIAYGIFRFLHEFLRDTPPLWGPFSGYQAFALGMVALGVTGYHRRARLGKKGGADAKILL
jgi:phosphatidylglycerol:prolipoprotein diacylglycerol transferase